jgi:endo-1,4-beta-xylanase
MLKINRRKFIQFTGGLTLTTVAPSSILRAAEIAQPKIELKAWDADGQPLEKNALDQLYFLDLQDEPIPELPRRVQAGTLFSELPPFPFAIALKRLVPGFGNVVLYADNQGRGYSPTNSSLDLNLEFTRSRLSRVRVALLAWGRAGIQLPPTIEARLTKAETYLREAETTDTVAARIKWCDRSLLESLWAGEEAVFATAQQEIAQRRSRSDFLFGCNFFGYSNNNEEYNQLFKQLFNFATVPFYWSTFEPKAGEKNFARVDTMVDWLNRSKITPKGHPLVYFNESVIPDWVRGKSYQEIKELTERRVSEITRYYGARIPFYDVINEAHNNPWANALNYSPEQLLDLTRIAAEASRFGNSQVTRIINSCCLWAENVAYEKPPQRSPYEYINACIAAEIPFEIIGVQLYYPGRDMFEINRMLERFSQFGKPIHITELGVASSTELDETAYLKKPSGLWHKPWSEEIQADWIEQFYTLCYSKPYIQAITWWDFVDYPGHFWPHGGLLNSNMTPKQSFYRLRNLLKRWQSGSIVGQKSVGLLA